MLQVELDHGGPEPIPLGEDHTFELRLKLDDNAPTITQAGSTLTLRDAAGTIVLDGVAVTVPSSPYGIARYAMDSTVTDDLAAADGWRGVWRVVIAGETHTVTRDYALCKYVPRCPISTQDLYERHATLRDEIPKGQTNFAPQIRQGWRRFNNHLYSQGRRPWLIVSAGSPIDCVLFETLAIIYRDAKNLNARYKDNAADYEKKANEAFDALTFRYDLDEDGVGDEDRAATPVIQLTAGPRPARYRLVG